ncbi:MAG: YjbQ family protein [Dehalococcoidia bacterium]|nr:YjbQ family protein [Dehalococcoidia bacterium]
MFRATIRVRSGRREELIEVTREVAHALAAGAANDGIVTLFVPHTTAAVTINENADPDVQHDMVAFLQRLVPSDAGFRHAEGNSDAHIKASLVGPSVQVPWVDGQLGLGRWQGLYFCEFDGPRTRELQVFVG